MKRRLPRTPSEWLKEIEEMSKDDIRRCTRDLLLVERARAWLVEDEA